MVHKFYTYTLVFLWRQTFVLLSRNWSRFSLTVLTCNLDLKYLTESKYDFYKYHLVCRCFNLLSAKLATKYSPTRIKYYSNTKWQCCVTTCTKDRRTQGEINLLTYSEIFQIQMYFMHIWPIMFRNLVVSKIEIIEVSFIANWILKRNYWFLKNHMILWVM